MKHLLIVICMCVYTDVFCQEKTQEDSVKQHLLSLEYKWLQAEFALDTAYLSSLMHSTFTNISNKEIHNKNQTLENIYNNIAQRIKDSVVVDSFRLENSVVNIYNNTVVAVFTVHTYKKEKGKPIQKRTRFYDVWIVDNKEWKAVSSQGTVVE